MLHASIGVELPFAVPFAQVRDHQCETIVLYANHAPDLIEPLRVLLSRAKPPRIYLPDAEPPLERAGQLSVLKLLVIQEDGLDVLFRRTIPPERSSGRGSSTLYDLVCYAEWCARYHRDNIEAHYFEPQQAYPPLYSGGRAWLLERLRRLEPYSLGDEQGRALITTRAGDKMVSWPADRYLEEWFVAKRQYELERKTEDLAALKRQIKEAEIEAAAARAAAVHAVKLGGEPEEIAMQLNISISDAEFLLSRPISCLNITRLHTWSERMTELEEHYDARLHQSVEESIRLGAA